MGKVVEYSIVAAIVAGLLALFYPVVQQIRSDGPIGEAVPSEAPDEAQRVVQPSGLSMVPPPKWRVQGVMDGFAHLHIYAGNGRSRSLASISIERLGSVPPPAELGNQTTFQGYPAWEEMKVTREWSFDDPASSTFTLYVDRDGEWWRINYGVSQRMTELPDAVRRYLDTIQFPPKAE